jgi:hypothetical protein
VQQALNKLASSLHQAHAATVSPPHVTLLVTCGGLRRSVGHALVSNSIDYQYDSNMGMGVRSLMVQCMSSANRAATTPQQKGPKWQ